MKSKQRVADHGEVFTAEREVNAMLDLVKQETDRIDSRFLEPACGTGNFLTEVLIRKLSIVEKKYKRNQLDFERYSVVAISSMYGVDILEDNIAECRERLFNIFNKKYMKIYKKKSKDSVRDSIKFILDKNIICGDALSLKTVGSNPIPITFSEWAMPFGSMIKRRDYYFETLTNDMKKDDLFSISENLKSDTGMDVFIPHPVKSYPATHFLRIADAW
ncbi:SAM-dependent DNA methyltransferase [Candidatus Woesearchaeota archaeon]|jgi:SAM-dependent methyltransferase|nr:SAM-dependent DNA methyltransferase [bacterium]MBT7557045.1 SAM-dependent DNA methyltransferase [Candidatus Woesearchaeota archaeon]